MIRLDRLTKCFGSRRALDALTLEVREGEIFGLLGHNGAGKSTAFGLVLGHLRATAGEAFIRGVSVQRDRLRALRGVGAIFETPAFYDYLSGWNNLRIFTGYSARLTDAEMMETVRYVGLEERIHDRVRVYSHGMRQRLALAQALLPKPQLVFLDEPAEGLDPEGIREMRHLIQRLNREHGMTVILSSHLLTEVEQLCDRIGILNQGRLIFQGTLAELRGDDRQWRLDIDDMEKATPVLSAFGMGGCGLDAQGELVPPVLVRLAPGADVADLVASLVQAGVRVRGVARERRTLEQLYLDTVASA